MSVAPTSKAVSWSDRVEPEAEAGREQLGLPALLHVLDHDGAAARPLHINARLRLRPPRRRPLQEDRHGQHFPAFLCNLFTAYLMKPLPFQVLVTNLELESVGHHEPANFWFGPSAVRDRIHRA